MFLACGGDDSTQTPSPEGGTGPDGGGTPDVGPAPDGAPHPPTPRCDTLRTLPTRTPTYFVDFDSGQDSADGKTQGTAWKHAPGDTNATGTPAAAKLDRKSTRLNSSH